MTTISTDAVRAGIDSDKGFGAITPPVYLSSNYSFEGYNKKRSYDYSRSGNPTRDILEQTLCQLEQGTGATVTASGMAAVSLPLQLLKTGDRLVIPHDCYGGSYRLFTHLAEKGHFHIDIIDLNNELEVKQAFDNQPTMIWIESPSNPLLRVVDIQKITAIAHRQNCMVVVDNTFLSPVLQQPLKLGADIVVHSTTKYINGHSDLVGGAVVSADIKIAEELDWWANCLGITGAPFDSFLTLRGLRTLPIRIKQHQKNTRAVVDYLLRQPQLKKIYYPGLKTHPGHKIALQQQQDFGAIVSIELDYDVEQIAIFLESLNIFSLAESLGGVESLICHPATMTHAAMDESSRARAGITQQLLRLSIGIEDKEDLIDDFEQAFAVVEEQSSNQALFQIMG